MTEALTTEPITDKHRYGLALLRAGPRTDPYVVATDTFPGDIPRAIQIANDWPADPEVRAVMDAYTPEEIDEMGVPTDNALIKEAWRRVLASTDNEIAFKGIDTIAKLRYKGGTGTTINNNTLVDNRSVMIVKDHGTDAEWEHALAAQQAKLVNDAA